MADQQGQGRGRGLTVPAWMSNNTPGGLSNGAAKGNPKDWTEHTAPDGRKYYHNKVTKVTTWEKPNELKSADELAASAGPWKEYTSDTGRKYYYNTITHQSSWELPTDKGQDVASPPGDSHHLPNSPDAGKKDSVTAFKDLLTSAGVKPTWSWEMTQGQISTDPRYKALKSMGERKQAFAEWIQQRKKQEEEDRRRKDRQIKEEYFLMLKDKDINPKMTWRKAQSIIETDPRYSAVDERDRELLFEEFLFELERREREDTAQTRKDAMLRFKKLLEATPSITVKTQWRKLKEQMADDPIFKALDKLDSLTVFEDHMIDLDHKEEEELRMERERQKRESRKARDAFRELLAEKLDQGELTLKTKWRDFVKLVKEKNDERYFNMFNSTGYGGESAKTSSTPHELFCDFLEDLEERIDKDKRILRDILKDINFTVGLNTSFEEFQNALSPHERYTTIPRQHLKHLFYELVDKAHSKEHSNQKRKKKLISAFKDMLKNFKEITPTSTWVDVRPLVLSQKEFEALDDEQEREKAFTEYITRLGEKQKSKEEDKEKEKKDEESGKSDEEEDEEKKKHRKKEHKSKSKKHRHRDEKDKDRKKKRHSHSSSDDDVPSKKLKKDRKDDDTQMEEGEEGERREKKGREEGENGEERKSVKREDDSIKKEEDGEERRRGGDDRYSRKDDRYVKREEEGDRYERRRRDERDEERGRERRDDRDREEGREGDGFRDGGRDDKDRQMERDHVKPPAEEKEEGETDDEKKPSVSRSDY